MIIIEDHAFSPLYDLAPPPPQVPLSPVSKLDRRYTVRLRKRNNLLTREGEGVGEEPNHTTARKPDQLPVSKWFF